MSTDPGPPAATPSGPEPVRASGEPLRVAVLGARGRMGSTVCRAVRAAPDLDLVAALDLPPEGEPGQHPAGTAHPGGPGTGTGVDPAAAAVTAGAQVAVDFTTPTAVLGSLATLVAGGVHVVVGTSGFDADRLATVQALVREHPGVAVMVVPNFAIGAVLMMAFAEQAARFYESVEILEGHHPAKTDAPSGTALATAAAVAAARAGAGLGDSPDATLTGLPGARGSTVHGIRVHSLRLRGLVAHQEVVFGGPGEILSVRHDSLDRESFMPGVLLAIRSVGDRPGLTVGLRALLNLT